ncbi:DoxX family protein [Teredinibacter purpureus]|uniref:DoxX family protein n=1 Tax=Teredinibacter purpureus TaxID=2731756 RepID=UPI0005F7FE1C|nr:DoxX family protein [Teredinibacter purpureus]
MNFIHRHYRLLLSVWIAFVFIQSLFFKFSGSPETQHIFGILGEWSGFLWFGIYGAYIVGVAELVAALLLFSRLQVWGAVLAFEIMCGAIVFHVFTPLGLLMPVFNENGTIIGDDGGALFIMACLTCASAAALIVTDWLSENSQLRSVLPQNRVGSR